MRSHNRTQTKPPERISGALLVNLQEELDKRISRYSQLKYFTFLQTKYTIEKQKSPPSELALVPSHYFLEMQLK